MAFNGNPAFEIYVKVLKEKYSLTMALETGTHVGTSTVFFTKVFDQVFTMDINDSFLAQAKVNLKDQSNVKIVRGNTGTELNKILDDIPKDTKMFIYLDAHWYDYWPLLDEIRQLATRKDIIYNSVMVVDDVKVPYRDDIPYDSYKGVALSYDFVKEELDKAFPLGYRIEYFTENPKTRGKLLIFPKQLDYPI